MVEQDHRIPEVSEYIRLPLWQQRKEVFMKNRKRLAAVIAAVVLACAAIWWFFFRTSGSSGTDVAYVQKISAMNGSASVMDRYGGVVESQQTADYKMDSGRTIEQIFVVPGQSVAEGTPLFRYSTTDAANKVASANLEIENCNNQISILASSGNSTDIQLQIRQFQYQIQVQQQEIAGYQKEIDNADVKASFDGVVKTVNETGLSADGMEAPIVTVAKTGEFRIKGTVSEQSIGMFSPGMEVFVRSRVRENQVWHGMVESVSSEPEQNNNDRYFYGGGESASKYPFYVTLDSTEGLMLGQHVYIEPDFGQGAKKEGLWLDMSFVTYDDAGNPFVWCGTSGRLKKQAVTLGETDEETGQTEILSGLDENDLIGWPDETWHEGMKAVSVTEGE